MNKIAPYMLLFGSVCIISILILNLPVTLSHTFALQEIIPTKVPKNTSVTDLSQVIQPNIDCTLPCLWGIYPGVTRLDEVVPLMKARFEATTVRRTGPAPDDPIIDIVVSGTDEIGQLIPVFVMGINAQDSVVNRVTVHSPPLDRFGSAPSAAWNYFSIQNVTTNLGVPDAIDTTMYQTDQGLVSVSLTLFWHSSNLAVFYSQLSPDSPYYSSDKKLCFTYENLDFMGIYLRAPNAPFSLMEMAGELSIRTVDLHAITDFSNTEFMEILVDGNGCLPSDLAVYWDRQWSWTPTLVPAYTLTPTFTITPLPTFTFTPSPTIAFTSTPAPSVSGLKAKVASCVLDKGIQNSLNAKIKAKSWQVFINEVTAQRNKKIPEPYATELIQMATYLRDNP